MKKEKSRKKETYKGQWIGILIYMLIGAACGVLILMIPNVRTGIVP